MAGGKSASVLRRKAERGKAAAGDIVRPPTPARALTEAFQRAAEEELRQPLTASETTQRMATTADLVVGLPERAFLGILVGPDNAMGLFCLDAEALAAIIEMRTLGRATARAAPVRQPTRTDAAMVVDLIDRVLAEFEAPLIATEAARWASGWHYQHFLPDPRPLMVTLGQETHRVLETELTFGDTTRTGKVLVALPAKGRGKPRQAAQPHPGSNEAEAAEAWNRVLQETVETATARLDAVLGRVRLSLSDLMRLSPGDRIAFPLTAMSHVRLVAPGQSTIASGRLGQTGGTRAVKLADPAEAKAHQAEDGVLIVAGALRGTSRPGPAEAPEDPEFSPAGPADMTGEPGPPPLGDLSE